MRAIEHLKSLFLYGGLDKEGYQKIKKTAYISNFQTWKYLTVMLFIFFVALLFTSILDPEESVSIIIYILGAALSGVISIAFFFIIKESALITQFMIYINIILLFTLGISLSVDTKDMWAVTFIATMVIVPMFMLDRPVHVILAMTIAAVAHIICSLTMKDDVAHYGDILNTCVYYVLGIIINIVNTSLRLKRFELEFRVMKERDTDALTGLRNKNAIMKDINKSIHVNPGNGVMLALDIDNFKSINDSYGHIAGDEILISIAEQIKKATQNYDITGRFGGDEFVCLLTASTIDDAEEVASNIISGVNKSVKTPNKNDVVKISIGIAKLDGYENDYDDAIKKADIALYESKENGKNKYSIYHEQL